MGAPAVSEERKSTRRGDDARLALIVAAERLFAEHGIAGVSLRDVSSTAGQRNHSAAQYHFGDRSGLVAGVYAAHMKRVDERRTALLAQWAESAGDMAGLVHAIVRPLVEEVTQSGGWYARFLVRTRWDPLALEVVSGLEVTGGLVAVGHEMVARLLHLPAPVRRNRFDQLLNLVISTLATWEWAHDRGEPRLDTDALIADLTATGTAVLLAPADIRPEPENP